MSVTHLGAIGPLHEELVLEHDEITLALLVLHERLKLSTKRVEKVATTGLDFLGREEADPAETRNDTGGLRRVREVAHRLDLSDKSAVKFRREVSNVLIPMDWEILQTSQKRPSHQWPSA